MKKTNSTSHLRKNTGFQEKLLILDQAETPETESTNNLMKRILINPLEIQMSDQRKEKSSWNYKYNYKNKDFMRKKMVF